MGAMQKAQELGATLRSGIAWVWALGFTQEKGEEFIKWLDANGGEHRGIYPRNDGSGLVDIRFR
jgi:hypothetical protein